MSINWHASSRHQIVVAVEHDPADENYQPLQTNLRMLQAYRAQRAEPLEIIPLPMPSPIYFDSNTVPASYCNFYIANRCVLVPQFDDAADSQALQILRPLFPDRAGNRHPGPRPRLGLGSIALHDAAATGQEGKV